MVTITKYLRCEYYKSALFLLSYKSISKYQACWFQREFKNQIGFTGSKIIQRVFKFLASSHANILMLFFKDMSSNEFVVDLFHDKNGELRSFQDFNQLFDPQQLGVFTRYFIC